MRTKSRTICLLVLIIINAFLTSCGNDPNGVSGSTHEPLTILAANKDYTEFEKAFKKAYPEVELKFIGCDCKSTCTCTQKTFKTCQAPDIYTLDILPDKETQKNYLIDLSVYDFSANYTVAQLNECSVDGAIYMFPSNYSVIGIYYNKTLFNNHGWTVPSSFRELEELVPKIKEANVDLACTDLGQTGIGFQYLFNLGNTVFLRTPDGVEWVENFLKGEADTDGVWNETIDYVQKWIDIGMIDSEWLGKESNEAIEHFKNGNTAFFVQGGTFRFTQNNDGTGDNYGIIPWLSEDGSVNRYITRTYCYYGLNAQLENPENRHKLQDALKFMEFMSSEEGQKLLPGTSNRLLPLSDGDSSKSDEYNEIIEMLNAGYNAPLTYSGWEGIIVPVDNECLKWYGRKSTGQQVLAVMKQARDNSLLVTTDVGHNRCMY